MLELATARADGDAHLPDELVNYAARSRAGKQLRVVSDPASPAAPLTSDPDAPAPRTAH
jgi:hypothetical protein